MTRANRKSSSPKIKIITFEETSNKISYDATLQGQHSGKKIVNNPKPKETYTFSSIFPNEDIMNRAHKVLSRVEFAK